VALVDYSVNDANGGGLYDNDEGKVTDAIVTLNDKLWPTPMVLIQTYPYNSRVDKEKGTVRVFRQGFTLEECH
jgi:hypothetical protein